MRGPERAFGVEGGVQRLFSRKAHQVVVPAAVVVLLELHRQVCVRVNEAGQQRHIPEIDDARVGGHAGRAHRHDAVTAHHDNGAVLQRRTGGIKQMSGFEHDGLGRRARGGRGVGCR
jgi:hypothetical protein